MQNEFVATAGRAVAFIIAGVSTFTALLVWLFWRTWKSIERAEHDPRYLRRRLFWMGMIYVLGTVFAVEQVAMGELPFQVLIGLPIPVGLASFWLRGAYRVKVRPEKPQ